MARVGLERLYNYPVKLFSKSFSQDALAVSLALMPVLAIAFLLPIQPNDYSWYVRLGGEIVRTGSIPTAEFMSYTQAGQPAVYQHWLAGVVFWGVEQMGGALLTNLLRGILLALFYGFTWKLCRAAGAGRWTAALFTLLAALAGSNNWAVRPQLFAYPLFGWTVWLLWRWHKGEARGLWGLPLAALLWVNLHGSVALLFVIGGAAVLAGRGRRKTLLVWLGAALLATFITPRGPLAWADALQLVSNPSNQLFSKEWQPPVNIGWQMNLFFGWLLSFPLLVGVSPSKPDRLAWLWFVGLGWLALSGVRYGIWFTGVLGFVSAGMAQPLVERFVKVRMRLGAAGMNLGLAGMFLLLPLLLLPGVRAGWWEAAPPVYSETTPVEAAAWLRGQPELPGPLWADLVYSSYLVQALPERPVWAYTRFEQFPPEHWERYLQIAGAEPGWQAALAQDGVRLLLLSKTDQPRLAQAVRLEPGWQVVYEDGVALILSR